jgi:hypothetical protein
MGESPTRPSLASQMLKGSTNDLLMHPATEAYAHATSHVCKTSHEPVWAQKFELKLRGGSIDSSGTYVNDEAPFTQLTIELWRRARSWSERDEQLGELQMPLVHLMDFQPHRSWRPIGSVRDASATRCAEEDESNGEASSSVGDLFVELNFMEE